MLILLTLMCAVSTPQEGPSQPAELYTKSEHRITMRDGVELYTAVYAPKAESDAPRPILLKRSPYSSRPYGADAFPDIVGPSRAAMEHGFIVAYQDVRGRYMSDGTYDNMRPHVPGDAAIDESSDTYDTVEWLVDNVPGNNGRVGMWGISYPGFYTTAALPEAHPALVAAVPQASISDFWFDDFHHQGAFLLSYLSATPVFGHQKHERTTESWYPRARIGGEDAYEFFRRLGPLSNASRVLSEGNAFWGQIVDHPNYDEFWRSRSILQHLKDIHTSVLVVGGLYDAEDLYGPFHIYEALERGNPNIENQLVMGPWGHGDWARNHGATQRVGDLDFGKGHAEFYAEEVELPFLMHHLEDGPEHDLPEALVFDTGAREWRRFDAWPPIEAEDQRLYLQAGGGLSGEAPGGGEVSTTEFTSDPSDPVPYRKEVEFRFTPRHYMGEDQAFAEEREDVLVFQTDPLTEDVTVAGELLVHLNVSTTGTDADWIVKLVDGHPAVDERPAMREMVRSEVMRARFRAGFESPKPFIPGTPTVVEVPLQGVLHTFKKGHRVVLHVQSSWFPLIDLNPQTFVPNIYRAPRAAFQAQRHAVHHDALLSSWVTFGWIPDGDVSPGD